MVALPKDQQELIVRLSEHFHNDELNPLQDKFQIHDFGLPVTVSVGELLLRELHKMGVRRICREYSSARSRMIAKGMLIPEDWIDNALANFRKEGLLEDYATGTYVQLMGKAWDLVGVRHALERYYEYYCYVTRTLKPMYDQLPPMYEPGKPGEERMVVVETACEEIERKGPDGTVIHSRARRFDHIPEDQAKGLEGQPRTFLNPEYLEARAEIDKRKTVLLNTWNFPSLDEGAWEQGVVQACLLPIAPYGVCLWPRSSFVSAVESHGLAVAELLDFAYQPRFGTVERLREWVLRESGKEVELLTVREIRGLRERVFPKKKAGSSEG